MKKSNHVSPLSSQRRQYLRQQKLRRISIFSTQIAVLIAFFALWEVAANLNWIDAFVTSQPSRMWQTLLAMHSSG
ncbi:MAG: ABC transporter permease, partial [Bacillota bacterium]|nr:ABC transporter permease [Bacillota bacterium]